jgi:hypothetical protein
LGVHNAALASSIISRADVVAKVANRRPRPLHAVFQEIVARLLAGVEFELRSPHLLASTVIRLSLPLVTRRRRAGQGELHDYAN